MKGIYTDEALNNLDRILAFTAANFPTTLTALEKRLRTVVLRIGTWPRSAEEVEDRPGVYAVPPIRYPYKIFYRITNDAVEILHIHHASRLAPWEEER